MDNNTASALRPAPAAQIVIDSDPESPWSGCVTVDAGYYGLVDTTRIGWCVEFAGDEATAQRIVANQAAVDAIVARHGGRARLSIKFDGSAMTVAEYDHRRWTETVEVAR